MNENHRELQRLGVSSPELDNLVKIALSSGALGAKLSGAGQGGNVIILVDPQNAEDIRKKMLLAGASNALVIEIL